MNEISDRNSVLMLLEKLGGEDDAEVLAAGRALHAKIDDMGVNWDQLLVPDDGQEAPETAAAYEDDDDDDDDEAFDHEDEDEDDGEDDDDDDDRSDDASVDEEEEDEEDEEDDDDDEFEPVGDAVDDLKLLDRLLATSGISSEFRDELRGYKEDIKAKEFSAADRKYIQALDMRLAGGKKSKPRRK
jgi:hypothetical protein